jgi:hypothetical protein
MSNFVHKSSNVEESQASNLSSLFNKRNKEAQSNQDRGAFKLENKVNNKKSIKLPFIKSRLPLQAVLGLVVLFLLVVGAASAMFLTTLNQDVRQQAKGCTYWKGGTATEGSTDDRGGVTQKCVNGYWSAPSTGTADSSSGGSSVADNSGGTSSCKSGEIFCGGCIAACRPATEGCNKQIDKECSGTNVDGSSCQGDGQFAQSANECCSGLQQCANGRCAPSCTLDKNDICGGIREGSNCNNGGSWTCDAKDPGGSGHCDGGAWNQPASERISCNVAGNTIYFASQESCDSAQASVAAGQAIIGGVSDVVEEIKSSFTSSRTTTNNIRCNLFGVILYTSDEGDCTTAGGLIGNLTLAEEECGGFLETPCEERDGARECNSGLELNTSGTQCRYPLRDSDCGGDTQSPCEYYGERQCNKGLELSNNGTLCELPVEDLESWINIGDCTDANRDNLSKGFGTCEPEDNGWVYESGSWVSYDSCVDNRRGEITNKLGSCTDGLNGWYYVANAIVEETTCGRSNQPLCYEISTGLGSCKDGYKSNDVGTRCVIAPSTELADCMETCTQNKSQNWCAINACAPEVELVQDPLEVLLTDSSCVTECADDSGDSRSQCIRLCDEPVDFDRCERENGEESGECSWSNDEGGYVFVETVTSEECESENDGTPGNCRLESEARGYTFVDPIKWGDCEKENESRSGSCEWVSDDDGWIFEEAVLSNPRSWTPSENPAIWFIDAIIPDVSLPQLNFDWFWNDNNSDEVGNYPQSISCYKITGQNCEQEVFDTNCPDNYSEGFCNDADELTVPVYEDELIEQASYDCHYETMAGECTSYPDEDKPCGALKLRDGLCTNVTYDCHLIASNGTDSVRCYSYPDNDEPCGSYSGRNLLNGLCD